MYNLIGLKTILRAAAYNQQEETAVGSTNISIDFDKSVKVYNVDIVMCIDATGSMTKLIDTVKRNALNFYRDVMNKMDKGGRGMGKHIDQLRVRVIVFRDYIADGDNAMLASDFYLLPDEEREFSEMVNEIAAFGGGDRPEDGLEALAFAIKSDWTKTTTARRHIIVVWTDDATHELGFGKKASNYPSGMPRDFEELTEWWGDPEYPGLMDNNAKRLLIFAPEKRYWTTIEENWDNAMFFPTEAGEGLREVEYQQILDSIYKSIS